MLRKVLNSSWLYYALAGVLAVAALWSQIEITYPPRPVGEPSEIRALRDRDDLNLILIVVDTLRADHLGSYGYERDTSPLMDDLAQTGVRFAHVRAQSSWTKSSMASLWTGNYPFAINVRDFEDALKESVVLPAEVLREAGFRTGGFYRNGWVAPNFGFAQGFEFYLVPVPNLGPDRLQRKSPSAAAIQGSDFDATEVAVEFVRSHAKERFFLYLHYMDVHQYQYERDSALFGVQYRDAYDNAIHWTDRNIGLLISDLIDLDLLEKTIIVIASDHREEFFEHGFEGHAKTLYRETTETPLILSLPFALAEPLVVETPVENIDIWPTLFDLLGIEGPESQGRSLLPLIEAAAAGKPGPGDADRSTMSQIDKSWGHRELPTNDLVSVSDGDHRAMFRVKTPEKGELYDLRSDPDEQVDLAPEQPERLAELVEHANEILDQHVGDMSEKIDLDDVTLEQLRALGYAVKP